MTEMRRLYVGSRLCAGRGRFGHSELEMSLRFLPEVLHAGVWKESGLKTLGLESWPTADI